MWVTGKSGSSRADFSKLELQLCKVRIIFKIVARELHIREIKTDMLKVAVLPEEKS
jgi:hypothetical protein